MAQPNPFDQFDAPQSAGNPFDQFDDHPVDRSASSRLQSVAGAVTGGFADIAGLPMDTAQNIIDLGKAAVGSISNATGHTVSRGDFLDIGDRADLPGSSEWIKKTLKEHGFGTGAVDPRDAFQRYSAAAVEGATGGALTGGEGAIPAAIGGATGGVTQQGVSDVGGGASAQALGGLLGGALGNKAAQQATRIPVSQTDEYNNAKAVGVDPTAGEAVPGMASTIQAYLAKVPGSAAKIAAAVNVNLDKAGQFVQQIADNLSPQRGASGEQSAGRAIRDGVADYFIPQFQATAKTLYDKATSLIPATHTAVPTQTASLLNELTKPFDGLPSTSAAMKGRQSPNSFLQATAEGFKDDLNNGTAQASGLGTPARVGGQIVGYTLPDGRFITVNQAAQMMAQAPSTGAISYAGLNSMREQVGQMLDTKDLVTPAPRAQLKRLYGAIANDMNASLADNPMAQQALSRANLYYKAGMSRVDTLQDVVQQAGGPENVFKSAMAGTRDGDSTLHAVMQSVPPEAQPVIASAVIRRMGRANPGAQNADGDQFSSNTFLSNWNRLSPQARQELFGRLGPQYQNDLDTVAKWASDVKNNQKVYANPSGTASANSLIATAGGMSGAMGAAGTELAHGNIGKAAVVAALPFAKLAANKAAAHLMTNPTFVKWLATTTKLPPSGLPAAVVALQSMAKQQGDAQMQQFASSLPTNSQ